MGRATLDGWSTAPSRLTRSHYLLLTIIVLIVVLIGTTPHTDAATYFQHLQRPQQELIRSRGKATSDGDTSEEVLSIYQQETTPDPPRSPYPDAFEPITDMSKVYPPPPPPDEEEYLAICLLVKDDAPELNEFFTHHYYHHSIRRFYIYDDGSNPPLSQHPSLSTYNIPASSQNFTYIPPDSVADGTPEREHLQQHTMERCIRDHGHKHTWLALLDPDEYIEMRHPSFPILHDWLHHWERNGSIGALAISWLPHTSSNLTTTPTSGGFRHNYDRCVSDPDSARADFWLATHSKSFVRPGLIESIPNIHATAFKDEGILRAGEQGDDAGAVSRVPPTTEFWGLHHYATGSRDYFEGKRAKGRSQGKGMWPVDETYWDRYHDARLREYKCGEMGRFVP